MDRVDRLSCEEALRRLEDFLDRELTADAMHRVQVHLDTCKACTEKFEFERGTLNALREKLRQASVPPELRAGIARSLDAERRASGE
jgi:anti-sigma factor (TIGR02949 family)